MGQFWSSWTEAKLTPTQSNTSTIGDVPPASLWCPITRKITNCCERAITDQLSSFPIANILEALLERSRRGLWRAELILYMTQYGLSLFERPLVIFPRPQGFSGINDGQRTGTCVLIKSAQFPLSDS